MSKNPIYQRVFPTITNTEKLLTTVEWRRGRDSNPRDSYPPTPLAGARLRPLGHLSEAVIKGENLVNQGVCAIYSWLCFCSKNATKSRFMQLRVVLCGKKLANFLLGLFSLKQGN